MNTKTLRKVAFALLVFILSNTAYSQDNMIFLGRNTPQKFLINPALVPDNAFLSMPILGGLNANLSGNISFNDVFSLTGNKATLEAKHLLGNLNETNKIRNILNLDILNMGFRISKNGFMGISLRARTSLDVSFSKDIVSFIMDNPLERRGIFDISLTPDVISWGELGISYSHRINKNFTVGARVKGIVGGVSAQAGHATILADKKLESYTLQGNVDIMAGNLNLTDDDEDTFALNNISPGFGIDLGMSYTSDNKKIKAYASISDFGRIYWNEKSSTRISTKNPDAKYTWVGVTDLEDLINKNKSFSDVLENTLDDMTATIGLDTIKTSFTSKLPLTIQAGGKYAFDDELKHNVSLNVMCVIPQFANTYCEITAGYTYSTKNKRWDLMGGYTYKTTNPFNIGIGGLYRGSGFEIFLMTDSINSYLDYKSARSANFRFGMNFYFPRYKVKMKQRNTVWE